MYENDKFKLSDPDPFFTGWIQHSCQNEINNPKA